jgi:ubiquinone/menaquinone biosynthesis C-methylase UbiE
VKGMLYTISGKVYDFLDTASEKRYKRIRKKILSPLKGIVLDAGCGTGRNFPYYGKHAKVIAVDNAVKMLSVARQRAKESKAQIRIEQETLTQLPFKNNTFDVVVATFVLWVMPKKDAQKALSELVRVAKPNARFYFLEYTYSQHFLRNVIILFTVSIAKLLYGIKIGVTLPLIKQEKSLEIENVELVYQDVLRLIIARKR